MRVTAAAAAMLRIFVTFAMPPLILSAAIISAASSAVTLLLPYTLMPFSAAAMRMRAFDVSRHAYDAAARYAMLITCHDIHAIYAAGEAKIKDTSLMLRLPLR